MGAGGAVSGVAEAPEAALPVVDLAAPEEEAAAVLKEACEGPGFFYLKGHGVPLELLSGVFEQTKALCALPVEEKMKLLRDENNRGYTEFGEQALDPARQKGRGDTKEGYYLGAETPADHPRAKLPLHGPNVWPDPALLPGFRPTMEQYRDTCKALCLRLLRIMALALGLPATHFLQPGMFDQPITTVRLLHYSLEASKPEEGLFACGAHTDFGMITVLATGGPGLQICRNPQEEPQVWEPVLDVEGAFVVNIGDMLERWTNGLWRSTMHRVIIPEGATKDRYSVPFFFEPNYECVVECLPCCSSPGKPPRWPPTTSGEHLLSMLKKTHSLY